MKKLLSEKQLAVLRKMALINTGKKRPPMSAEWREKISKAQIGMKRFFTDSHKKNISIGAKKRGVPSGEKSPNWRGGKPKCQDCGCLLKWRYGKKCRACYSKGNKTKLDKKIRKSKAYIQWRSDVFTRDAWTCKTCGKVGGKYNLNAHHIVAFSKLLKDNSIKTLGDALECKHLWDTNNGITLCLACHRLTDNYGAKSIKK